MTSSKSRVLLSVFLLLLFTFVLALHPISAQADGVNLRWSIEGINDLPSLDPAKASDSQGFTVIGLLYGGLVRLDGDLNVIPDLAESWTVSDDGLVYTFTLREDSLFSDGSAITADDVVWSLTHALDPNTGGWTGPFYLSNIVGANEVAEGSAAELAGAVAVDARTVELTISQPSAYFLSQLTFGSAKVVSKAQAEADPSGWENAPVTSGPFQVQAWNHGQNIILVPNTNYWQAPTIATLTMPFIQDSETAYQLYITGELDIMGSQQNGIPSVHVPDSEMMPDFRSTPLFAVRYVGFNNTIPPFDNVNVRRAFALAIDKETLANDVLGGTVVPSDRILPLGIPGSELPIDGLSFDPDGAKAALAEAGVTPETIGQVTLTYGVEGDNERVVTVLQAMWQENLGVAVTLEPLELTTFSARLNETYETPETGIQAYYSVWGADYPDPQNFISQQLRTGVGNNNGHYSNAEFDALVDEADVLTGDVERRMSLYNDAEQIAVNEVGWLPLFNPRLNILVRPEVEGIVFNGQGLIIPDYSALTVSAGA
ncbi:MAG: peptide ABC transporter substrate-binding protein [Anaerolineae bacterium]|nr:peptide ABC transporter substrate-binding protein [Anaerolineae bacterium]MCA9908130.1 peptide ABC transporter substrate-binding protein [Anaerolineae bacterium]